MSKKITRSRKVAEEPEEGERYVLKLFVAGMTPNSKYAVKNITEICEKYLAGNFDLEIIDIYQQPDLALDEEIVAIPMLLKKFPLPEERMVGDLSNTERVVRGLGLI